MSAHARRNALETTSAPSAEVPTANSTWQCVVAKLDKLELRLELVAGAANGSAPNAISSSQAISSRKSLRQLQQIFCLQPGTLSWRCTMAFCHNLCAGLHGAFRLFWMAVSGRNREVQAVQSTRCALTGCVL